MSARVVSLVDWIAPQRDWSQRELAEFYRVEAALLQAGLRIETDRGVTDEGDPWFVFCRADDGEVFIHFARSRGEYLIAGPGYDGLSRGRDFAALTRDIISRHPLVQTPAGRKSNVFMHPAALLIAIVGTAFFKTGEAKAAEDGPHRAETRRQLFVGAASGAAVTGPHTVATDAHQTLVLVASALSAITWASEDARQDTSRAAYLVDPVAETLWVADTAGAPIVERPVAARTQAPMVSAPASPQQAISQAQPAQVAEVLALVSLLADLAQPGRGERFAAASLEATGAEAARAGSANGAPLPLLLVELKPGALPDIAAVRFLQDGRAGVDLSSVKVITVDELPQFLSELLQNGLQLQAGATESLPPLSPADAIPTLDVDGGPVGDPHVGAAHPGAGAPPPAADPLPEPAANSGAAPPGVSPPPLAGSDLPVTGDAQPAPAPVSGGPEPATSPLPPAGGPGLPVELRDLFNDAELESAITKFLSLTPRYEVMVSNREVVLYDAQLMSDSALLRTAQSITFHFADGSSISLVGTPAALDDATDLLGLG